jgi:16S rRNA (guanine527-N7)-methyltransferase
VRADVRAETIETLREAQRFGFLGGRPVEEAAEHAMGFVVALGAMGPGTRLVDLGSGGGLPGLVLADLYPECSIVLLDRRQKRTDFLARAASRLGHTHVEVRCTDAAEVARKVETGAERAFDAVTARGFGPPELTLRLAHRLAAGRGRIVISEPPSGDRWEADLLEELGLQSERVGPVRRFTVRRRFT